LVIPISEVPSGFVLTS